VARIHSFAESLAQSAAYVDAPWWFDVYRSAFPTMQSCVAVRNDGWAQRAGIDRVLTLECGRVVRIDEKVRERDYGDILLEYWSDEARKVKGWVCKPLNCDFIAYAIAPVATCYLFPVLPLQRAWHLNAQKWAVDARDGKDGFSIRKALNERHTTVSMAVPTKVLLAAIGQALIVQWGKPESEAA
jgi:hypothetical protein